MKYSDEFNDPNSEIRTAIVNVAEYFSALIRHDAGDEIPDWS